MEEAVCACGCGQPIPWKPHHAKKPPMFISGHNSKSEKMRANCAKAARIRSDRSKAAEEGESRQKTVCACGCGGTIPWKPHHRRYPPRFIHGHNTNSADYKKLRKDQALKPPDDWIPPTGICECGCKGRTAIVKVTNVGLGRYAGYPNRFILGHNRRGRIGEEAHGWKGGRARTTAGYVRIYRPDHPRAKSSGYVSEHILVWEQVNGRLLLPNEAVHHINGVKDDNRPENLVALTRSAHARLHAEDDDGKRKRADGARKRGERIRQENAPPPWWEPPSGLCECGCGQKTALATTTNRKHGHYVGYPMRFISGHNARRTRT